MSFLNSSTSLTREPIAICYIDILYTHARVLVCLLAASDTRATYAPQCTMCVCLHVGRVLIVDS